MKQKKTTDKKVYILRGPSGCGKSSWTQKLREDLGANSLTPEVKVTTVSADFFFTRGGEYDFDVKKLPEAHQWCLNQFLLALREEIPVIVVDNTNERKWEYENFILAAELAGYEVEIMEWAVTTISHMRACAERNKHNVPLALIAKKAASIEEDPRATRVPFQ